MGVVVVPELGNMLLPTPLCKSALAMGMSLADGMS